MPSKNKKKNTTPHVGNGRDGYNHSPVELLESRCLLSASTTINAAPNLVITPATAGSSFTGYTPAQIKAAYGFNQISGDGTGQTIAIVDAYDDPNIAADLHAFDVQYGLADPTLTKLSQTGGSTENVAADAGWAGEIALDVEWAHAIAPGAKIVLVEANSSGLTDLMAAVDVARRVSGVSVVSMSWGASEFAGQTYFDKYFTTPKGHTGVTFVAASGDQGSWYGPDFPATSSYVLAVGGTTMNLTSSGAYAGETGWSGSTGGVSSVVGEPSYQATAQSTGLRSSPDVSYDANPNTGFAVYDSYSGGWTVVGGTSAGAPQWGALIALADQARAANGLAALDGATGTLPALYKLYTSATSSAYTSTFHDVTVGRSSAFYSSAAGYDAVTGLGTPQAASVVADLVSATAVRLTTVSGPRARQRSAAAAVTSATATTITGSASGASSSLVHPTKPTIVYSLRPSNARGVFEALVDESSTSQAQTRQIVAPPVQLFAPIINDSVAAATRHHFSRSAVQSGSAIDSSVLSNFASGVAVTSIDASGAFADAATLFAQEASHAAGDEPIEAVGATHSSQPRAWITTLAVLAVDAVLIGRWYTHRSAERRTTPSSPFAITPLTRDWDGED